VAGAGARIRALESRRAVGTYVIDTNVFDALSADDALLERARRLCAAGVVRFETSQVQERELGLLRDADRGRHRRADRIPRFVVAAVEGPGGGGRHERDARIAATARRDGHTLVTDDAALREHAATVGVEAWDSARLIAALARADTPGG